MSNEHRYIHDMSKPPSSIFARYIYTSKVEWYWKCLLRPLLLRIGAGLAAIMSVLIVWSEVSLSRNFHFHKYVFVHQKLIIYSYDTVKSLIADNILQ